MGDTPGDNIFDISTFPDLYPKNMQDAVNDSYTHDKVLPRVEGKDYNTTSTNPAHEINLDYSKEGSDDISYT